MNKATAVGFLAILMWALLATLTTFTGRVPSLLLTAMTFFIGALPGIILWIKKPETLRDLKQPLIVWLIGIGGLFGYHFLYFTALRNAPPVEAALICYLWPLFIVLGSALMPGEKLHWFHVVGALCGFAGMVLVVTGKGGLALDAKNSFGYLVALASAFTWATYSLLSRRVSKVPTTVVTAFCLATSFLALGAHFLFQEPRILPADGGQWLAVLLLGLFPVGMAFYCWDYGVKRGNIQLLGVASYSAPLLSTLLMVATGLAEPTWRLLIACLLITGGAILASKNLLLRPKR
ncbi:aromatic amino acid exporter YddG [Bartonella sp. LJL80]